LVKIKEEKVTDWEDLEICLPYRFFSKAGERNSSSGPGDVWVLFHSSEFVPCFWCLFMEPGKSSRFQYEFVLSAVHSSHTVFVLIWLFGLYDAN
jgi:hypothetical protein